MHHSISIKILSLTHWNVSDTFNKFQLCTSNLKVPTHESNYVYRYVRFANSFSYKAIFTLDNRDFELRCIIQYRWKFCPSHIEMCRYTQFNKFQLCTSNLKVPTHESNYVYRYVRFANSFKVTKPYSHWKSRFLRGCISILMKILSLTHWNVSDTFNKYRFVKFCSNSWIKKCISLREI